MIVEVIGTPDSGKSALAEELIIKLAKGESTGYLATMVPFDEEGRKRIKKHRKSREGKGFITFEKDRKLEEIVYAFKENKVKNCLLECVSNLVGNEIYSKENLSKSEEELVALVNNEIFTLAKELDNLVIVANLFEEEKSFDEETQRYVRIQNRVTELISEGVNVFYKKSGDDWIKYENN